MNGDARLKARRATTLEIREAAKVAIVRMHRATSGEVADDVERSLYPLWVTRDRVSSELRALEKQGVCFRCELPGQSPANRYRWENTWEAVLETHT